MANWKEIIGYEGLYLISDEGEVISLPRTYRAKGKVYHRSKHTLKNYLRGRGKLMYEAVALSKNGETKTHSVHRLVAEAFIPNPDNLPEINHKDENPLNNSVSNLEWCTRQYNIDYSKSKAIIQYSNGKEVGRYKSIAEASRITGIGRTSINNVLTGWSKVCGGFTWSYAI